MNPTPLPLALTGTRHETDDARVGHLSWYQSAPSGHAKSATPLLLVHSVNAAASAYEVKPLYEHYARQRPVFALDLPGFGFSERSDRLYSPRLMTDALHVVLEEIRRKHGAVPIDALAVSLGSEFLARAAVESPTAFRSVALVSPSGFNSRKLREAPEGSTLAMSGFFGTVKALGLRRPLFSALTRRNVIRYFLRRTWGSQNIDEGMLDYDFATTRPAGAEYAPLQFVTGFLFSGDSGRLYRALVPPIWVVHGVRGDFTNYHGIKQLADRPNWKVEVMQTGALPYFEKFDEFLGRYEAWSSRVGAH
jgi:pimeloyl-ACP methyl ester carboxylesterase